MCCHANRFFFNVALFELLMSTSAPLRQILVATALLTGGGDLRLRFFFFLVIYFTYKALPLLADTGERGLELFPHSD